MLSLEFYLPLIFHCPDLNILSFQKMKAFLSLILENHRLLGASTDPHRSRPVIPNMFLHDYGAIY